MVCFVIFTHLNSVGGAAELGNCIDRRLGTMRPNRSL